MVVSSSLKDMTSTITERRQIASCSPRHPAGRLFAPGATHAPGGEGVPSVSRLRGQDALAPRRHVHRVYEGKMPSLPGDM